MAASPEYGGKCRACEAIGACLRIQVRILFVGFAHTYFFLTFLLTLAPFVNLSVDTFPDKRGQLTFPVLFFLGEKSFTPLENAIHPCRFVRNFFTFLLILAPSDG